MSIISMNAAPGATNEGSKKMKHSSEGVVFTPTNAAEELLRSTFSKLPKTGPILILEPSSGIGNLVQAVLSILNEQKVAPKRVKIVSCELNERYLQIQRANIHEQFPGWERSITFKKGDFLTDFKTENQFDFVVMNPPWVGYRNISSESKFYIKSAFGLSGQFDLLDPFVIKCFDSLKLTGKMALFLPDKVISSHQPSNSIDIVRPFCAKFSLKKLPIDFFFGVQHESVFIALEKGSRKLGLIDSKAVNAGPKLGDFFQLFRGFEISGRSSEYLVGQPAKALEPDRPFVSGQEITDSGSLDLTSPRYISKKVPSSLIKDHFNYCGPAVLVRKTGSPVRIAFVDSLPHVSQVVFVIVPRAGIVGKKELRELANYLRSEEGQEYLAGNSGKLGRALFPYVTISDIKNVPLTSAFVATLSQRQEPWLAI